MRCLIVAVLFTMLSCVSNETKIGDYENPQKALLVMDMQIDFIGESAKFPIDVDRIDDLVNTTNRIIEECHNRNYIIIYIRNTFKENDWLNTFRNNAAIKGTLGAEIDPRINIISENIFDKYSLSAFSNSDFEVFLIENQINELYLCGVMADQCVFETAIAAFNRNYTVNYIANAVSSTNTKKIENAIKRLNKKGINVIEL